MEDDYGLAVAHHEMHHVRVLDIGYPMTEHLVDSDCQKKALGHFGQRKPGHPRAQPMQPQREPAALETGVPGQEDAAPTPELRCHDQTFHGAAPLAQSSSSCRLSRSVSIGRQKPWCRKAASC